MSDDVSKGLSDLESKLHELGELAAAEDPATGAAPEIAGPAAGGQPDGQEDQMSVRDERPRAGSRSAGTADLEETRASVDRIAVELRSGFDELIALRGRLEESTNSLIEDYERLLAGHGSPTEHPRD